MKKITTGWLLCFLVPNNFALLELNPIAFRYVSQIQLLAVQIILVFSPNTFALWVIFMCCLAYLRC